MIKNEVRVYKQILYSVRNSGLKKEVEVLEKDRFTDPVNALCGKV